jgi:hypothetical protein
VAVTVVKGNSFGNATYLGQATIQFDDGQIAAAVAFKPAKTNSFPVAAHHALHERADPKRLMGLEPMTFCPGWVETSVQVFWIPPRETSTYTGSSLVLICSDSNPRLRASKSVCVKNGGSMQRRDPDGAELRAITELVQLAGRRVVDVGCGSGRLTRMAAKHAASVYAFDPNEATVKDARESLPAGLRGRVSFRVHGVDELDVARRRFDIALCGWSL